MGIPSAGKVYESTYGVNNARVIFEEREIEEEIASVFCSSSTSIPDFSLDLVDFPTFNIAAITSLGREIASNIFSTVVKGDTNLGQIIVFYDCITNHILDTLHDKTNALTDDDTNVINIGSNKSAVMLRSIVTMCSGTSSWLVKEFYAKLKNFDKRTVRVKRIPVVFPSCLEEVKNLINPRLTDTMMTPPPSVNIINDYKGMNQWLLKHETLKTRQFITNRHIFNNSHCLSNCSTPAVSRYRDAYYASELEGLILLYAHQMMRTLKRVLKSSNERGRYVILFIDGQAPAIKRMTRLKRQNRQHSIDFNKELKMLEGDALWDALIHSCERMVMKIPPQLLICTLLDVMRIPLVRMIGAKGLYLSLSVFSEAEDDIVRLASSLLNLETPMKHFQVMEKKVLIEHDTENPTNKTYTKWSDIISVVKRHTISDQGKMSVNLFSHDSDVLAKWNLMVAHHHQVCKLMNINQLNPEVKLECCRFFRSRTVPPNSLITFKKRPTPIVYDLSESPVLLSSESTLLIMLTKGSDYNTALVSDSTYDCQIRTEAAMFERMSCTCLSGWNTFLDNKQANDNNSSSSDHLGVVSEFNLSKEPCKMCGKYLVMPFWSIKLFFTAQAMEFVLRPKDLIFPPTDDKYSIHLSLAINAAANIMASLTMGSFNQRVFGSISSSSKLITSIIFGDGDDGGGAATAAAAESSSSSSSPSSLLMAALEKSITTTIFEKKNEGLTWNKKRKNNKGDIGAAKVSRKEPPNPMLPISKVLSIAIYNARQEFFANHTQGGLPLEMEEVKRNKQELFGCAFPSPSVAKAKIDNIFKLTEEEIMDYYTLFGNEVFSNVKEEEEEKNDWMAKAARAFSMKNYQSLFLSNLKTETVAPLSPPPPPPLPSPQIMPLTTLMEEFARCMSISNVKFTKESLLSKLTNILYATTKGIDDDRINGIPYSIKTMNLLVILYMNMCGLQDQWIVNEQLIPVIHEEYCTTHNSNNSREFNTDRTNFMAAVLEYTFLIYGSEMGPKSRIKQAKRQNWERLINKIRILVEKVGVCMDNCKRLINEVQQPSANEKIWVPGQDFMPLFGLTVTKPWTPLALWSSFLSYYQKEQQQMTLSYYQKEQQQNV